MSFVHLHTHSEYSLLDGAARLKGLVKRAAELDMPALALTDHGVMYGALDFYNECKQAGIKPIVGVEAYVAPGSHKERTKAPPPSASEGGKGTGKSAYHLLLLAKDLQGYKNLLKLTTIAAVEGFYYKPRIDHELLAAHKEGIIATSACLGGEVCTALMQGRYEKARDIAGFYRDLLGRDNYYIELQDHTLPKQRECNEHLLKIARELGLQILCTNDVHYLDQKDADAHDVLLCIGTGSTLDEPNRMRYEADQFYMKSVEEMARCFPDHPGALEQTLEIAERCNLDMGQFGRAPLPAPGVPEGETANSYLRRLAEEGLRRRIGDNAPEHYRQRLEYELGIIEKTGFPQYILIVRDFARFARQKGIYFGVRGSAAGSLASFCVDITDIDPVDYGLTFERFLNPERVTMPDIDMDFEDARRAEVIDYVTKKYGEEHVAQIITFGTLGARAALKDTGRVLGMPIADVNRLCGMIPTLPLGLTIERSMEMNPELKSAYVREPQVKQLVDTARRLEGISRHHSVHAAGVVISHEPLVEYTPLQRNNDGGYVTQFSAANLEQLGLLKMDFLGLINLSILGRTVENIKKSHGIGIDLQHIPLDDKKAFALLGRGDTTGIFQLESAGMRRYVVELKPTSVRELAAMVALYRPGPMEHIPTYIRAKHGLQKISYPHPLLEEVLQETYGVIVYQDQVMQIARAIAGYSLGQADILRRAMGKKSKETMAKERQKFIEGAAQKGITEKKAVEIFNLIEPFAGYAFNKAHAVCYAMVAYQTAYLKANYPIEYMAALLACYTGKADKVAHCMDECSRMSVRVLPPDVNLSDVDFVAEYEAELGSWGAGECGSTEATPAAVQDLNDGMSLFGGDESARDQATTLLPYSPTPLLPNSGAIRFGLAGIKNVGRAAVDAILAARANGGPFRSLQEFCDRTLAQGAVTRATIEALIKCGAFSSIHTNRRALVEALDSACRVATNAQRAREAGQEALFGGSLVPDEPTAKDVALPNVPDYASEEILAFEKDLLGIYVSDHPLAKHRAALEKFATTTVDGLGEMGDRQEVKLGGIITTVKPFTSKKSGEPMCFLTLEDLSGKSVAVTVFPSVYRDYAKAIQKDGIVLLAGRTSIRDRIRDDDAEGAAVEVLAESITAISNGAHTNGNGGPKLLEIRFDASQRAVVRLVRSTLEDHPGPLPVQLLVRQATAMYRRRTTITVDASDDLLRKLGELVGREAVRVE